ncbi:glycosyltransferase family 2 protein [Psychrosphaera sp. B3R10]|uniref:glycosyltransferase family 2 protein n=1 Tax=unclassified Psychrosphaera TaxID=2641570 RepID=UPI001C0A2248|nr:MULTISPECIES: glycosyltransferase family 2 protein [unclassified Psychrosphaera]MBU2881020.1 glycosyltransferase family 2 protein [Psychrosphaera sp. I2R16]MBU2989944.1 glycosyltransferase family 2 protein [Psychrosphaera sp. B3R10]
MTSHATNAQPTTRSNSSSHVSPTSKINLSLVVPLYKEQDNIHPLFTRIQNALGPTQFNWEVICVDDGSPDATLSELHSANKQFGEHFRIVELQRNFGQTAAMQAGIDVARGDIIVTMDGDLQNDPADIPRMVSELQERNLDMLQGWRKARKDNWLLRKLPSKIANKLIAKITGVKLKDYGCSLKVYRAGVIKQIRLFGEMHRFIPAWVASVTKPSRIGETQVTHHSRQFGESKYGLSRTFRVLLDLLSVSFFIKFAARPGHFFGYVGLTLLTIGGLIMSYLAGLKFILGEDIGGRPMFFIGILFLIAALQMLTTGVLAEIMSRVLFQSTNTKGYSIRNSVVVPADACWSAPSHSQLDTSTNSSNEVKTGTC